MVSSDLDRRSKRVLEAIYQHGGEAEMSEIKEYTGIEKNGIVLYRLNEKLGPEGLVETRKVDQGDGNLGVTVASLTENGKRAVGRVMDDDESGPTLAEQMNILRSEVEQLKHTVEMYEGVVEDTNEDMAEARETARRLEESLDRIEAVEKRSERLDDLRDNLQERIEKEVESAVKSRHFVGVDLAAMLHEAGVVSAPRTDDHKADTWDALAGISQSPSSSSRLVGPGPRLPELRPGTVVSSEHAEKIERLGRIGALDQLLDQFGEVSTEEEVEESVSYCETEEGEKALDHLRQIDALEEGLRSRPDVGDHLRNNGFDVGPEEVRELTDRVPVFQPGDRRE